MKTPEQIKELIDSDKRVGFLPFFLIWADIMGWRVPDIHVRLCLFLQQYATNSVNRQCVVTMFRGVSKSTTLGIYNAWRWYLDPTHRILHQGADQILSNKCSRDSKGVVERHPLCKHLLPITGDVEFWWVRGATDTRNPSFQAKSIVGTVVSSRADECQNDDVEVPKNVNHEENRESLRTSLAQQVFILVPGSGQSMFIGTPHTYDSVYKEKTQDGSAHFHAPLYGKSHRATGHHIKKNFDVGFKPALAFGGMGRGCKMFTEPEHYVSNEDGSVTFHEPPCVDLDFYAEPAWPERFTAEETHLRRKAITQLGLWDSQYMLVATPANTSRLNPDRMKVYTEEPEVVQYGGTIFEPQVRYEMRLRGLPMRMGIAYWDPSLGNVYGDVSALSIVYMGMQGEYYWHRAVKLSGDVESSQIPELMSVMRDASILLLVYETNGPGGHLPGILRKHLHGTGLRMKQVYNVTSKAERILDNIEPPLSCGNLYVNQQVVEAYEGSVMSQMREWDAQSRSKRQKDDFIDSLAGAIENMPMIQPRAKSVTSEVVATIDWQHTAKSGVVKLSLKDQADYGRLT